jgi:hypothetical protein
MYENIEELGNVFVYMLLDILDNSNNYNDLLDVLVVVYERKVMMYNKDYLLLLNEHWINSNLVMKLVSQ